MTDPSKEELWGQPKGLYVLFLVEMWERFSYYGMRAILVLYMIAMTKDGPMGGLGWTEAEAIGLYGTYTMSVYLASVPGGWLADNVFGQRKAVMIGGLILCAGHSVLALPGMTAFYLGLGLIVVGVGLLKPNISTLVGGLYPAGDPRRDKGFYIFYMGINLGAAGSGIIVGGVAEFFGWHYGFGLAGIGMLAGQVVYWRGQKYLQGVGDLASQSSDPAHGAAMERPLTHVEKQRMIVLLLSFSLVIVFWGAFEQAGGLMNIIAAKRTELGFFKASQLQSLNPIYILILGVPIANFWISWQAKGRESSALFKMSVGTAIMGLGFVFMVFASLQAGDDGKAGIYWLFLAYLFHTVGELCSSPVSLSFITKLAPVKYASLMMGTYFAATGLGNKLAGFVGEKAVSGAGEVPVFIGITVFCCAFAGLVLLFLKPLKKLCHHAEDGADENGKMPGEDKAESSFPGVAQPS